MCVFLRELGGSVVVAANDEFVSGDEVAVVSVGSDVLPSTCLPTIATMFCQVQGPQYNAAHAHTLHCSSPSLPVSHSRCSFSDCLSLKTLRFVLTLTLCFSLSLTLCCSSHTTLQLSLTLHCSSHLLFRATWFPRKHSGMTSE